jgi:hypothetical protein
VSNIDLREATYYFKTGKVKTIAKNTQSFAFGLGAKKVRSTMNKFIMDALKNSVFTKRSYNPFTDKNLLKNILGLEKNYKFPPQGFCFGGKPTQVSAKHLRAPSFWMSFDTRKGYESDQIILEKGSYLRVNLRLRGSLKQALRKNIKLQSFRAEAREPRGKREALSVKVTKFCKIFLLPLFCF